MINLAKHEYCTGCGACSFICPQKCLTMQENTEGIVLPYINEEKCIQCHSCERVCPILNIPALSPPNHAYSAWSKDKEERRTSASGGVAAEMYKTMTSMGGAVVGASQNPDFSVELKIIDKSQEWVPFKNSKYVFSTAYELYPQIKEKYKQNKKILFIGLPCQVAAIKSLFPHFPNIILVDLVCHGTTPFSYLRQHILYLESREGHKAQRMCFRDPDTDTYTYTFTLYDQNNRRFYAQRTKDADSYQYGYHKGINYRENCYHCPFARKERVSDITIGDYHGQRLQKNMGYSNKKVSVVLTNTSKGKAFLQDVIETGRLHIDEQPLNDPIEGEHQLRCPSQKHWARRKFEKEIKDKKGQYEAAIGNIITMDIRRNSILKIIRITKRLIKKIKKIKSNDSRHRYDT